MIYLAAPEILNWLLSNFIARTFLIINNFKNYSV